VSHAYLREPLTRSPNKEKGHVKMVALLQKRESFSCNERTDTRGKLNSTEKIDWYKQ